MEDEVDVSSTRDVDVLGTQFNLLLSNGVAAVLAADCVEPLLHFVLSSSHELDLRLSQDYCAQLLAHDPSLWQYDRLRYLLRDSHDGAGDLGGGVPSYPLYKQVASALSRCMRGASIRRSDDSDQSIRGGGSLQEEKIESWDIMIAEKVLELENMLTRVEFEIHVQEPFFTLLRNGSKSVEGRCAVGDYNRMSPGAFLLVNKCLLLEIQAVSRYSSFSDMLKAEGLANVLPGTNTIEEGVQIYRKFYSEDKEKSNGVLAICVLVMACQPYITIASLVSELGYKGIGRLLGLTHTAGTVDDALPPARSILISSFMKLYKPEVRGCILSYGARALAKHCNRSTDRWWGILQGNDYDKNNLALKCIMLLITRCCWMNIHCVPSSGCVMEVRVADGYGARWSVDGSKFIGFLEPYTEDGYSKKWRH